MAIFTDVFDDVTKLGRKIPTSDYQENGEHPIIDQGQNEIAGYTDETDGLFTDVPAIIFGDHTRVVKYVDTPCFLGADGVKLLKAKNPQANHKYLYHVLANAKIPNTGYNRHFKWLKEVNIPLPNEAEQQRIVEVLDRLDDLIAMRKEQLAKLDELVKARFVEMFGNNTDSGVPLRDCCIDVRGGGTPSMQHPEYYGGNVPFIKSGDVRGDLVHSGTLWLTEKALSDTPAKFVPKGAVLVVNRSAALLREFRAAIAEQPVVINQDIKAFIPKPEYASEYLLWAIKIQTQYLLTRVTTVLTSHIDLKDLLELKIMPASCEEQALFTQFISETNKTKLTIQASLDKLEVMKKALMQEYFG